MMLLQVPDPRNVIRLNIASDTEENSSTSTTSSTSEDEVDHHTETVGLKHVSLQMKYRKSKNFIGD